MNLERVELRIPVRTYSASTSTNPAVDAGALGRIISSSWIHGCFQLCLVIEQSPNPDQVGLIVVVSASDTKIPRGDKP